MIYNLRAFAQHFTALDRRLLTSLKVKYKMASLCDCKNNGLKYKSTSGTEFKPVTHCIFDMDGLILDTEVIYKQIIRDICESYGKEYTNEVQLKVLGTTEHRTADLVVHETPLPITIQEFTKMFKERQIMLAKAYLMEGAERLIRHLHKNNIPIAVATSSGAESVKIKTERYQDLFSLFHHIVMGSSDPQVKQGKPAPDIFQVCAQRFNDKPPYDKCLVFEDAPNGVTGAVAAGMQTVMVPDPQLPEERTTHATMVLKTLHDFQPELFGLPPF